MTRNKRPRHSRSRWFSAIMGFAVQKNYEPLPGAELSARLVTAVSAAVVQPVSVEPANWPRLPILPPPPADSHGRSKSGSRRRHGHVQQPQPWSVLPEFKDLQPDLPVPDPATSASAAELLERMRAALPPGPSDCPLPVSPTRSVQVSWYELVRSLRARKLEILTDGKRQETFSDGAILLKDSVGRVIEARSNVGDSLYFTYGRLGALESFTRTDAAGATHSTGRYERHGVIVRDAEGRVRAAGESMTVDSTGGVYLHGVDGQYFCLDVVRGLFRERRRVGPMHGGPAVMTALFAGDGFRMATVVFRDATKDDSTRGGACFRFYGRDGSLVEFACEEDVRRLHPRRVSAPATLPVRAGLGKQVQARTAWQAVYEYLARVS